jgi:hypothetical protein
MRQVRMTLAAAVATAMVVVAVAALDAVGADKVFAGSDPTMAIADCLRDHGVAVPNLTGDELARWLETHELPEATARACKQAIAPQLAKQPGEQELVACLRAHGLTPPTDPTALKRWIGEQGGTAAIRALKQCGLGPQPSGTCGDKDEVAKPDDALKKETVDPAADESGT